MNFYSAEHQLTALDLAIAEFRRKSTRHRDTWDNAANALAYTRSQVKSGATAQRKRATRPENDLSREIQSVFAQAVRR